VPGKRGSDGCYGIAGRRKPSWQWPTPCCAWSTTSRASCAGVRWN